MKRSFDPWIVLSLVGLSLFSSLSFLGIARQDLKTHLIYIFIGFISLYVFYKWGVGFLRLNDRLLYIIGLLFIIGTVLFGQEVRGSRRWIDFSFVNFQPSEFFKIVFIIIISGILAREQIIREGTTAKKILVSFIFFALPTFIIFKQPDLGTAIVYAVIYVGVLFFSGAHARYFLYTLLGGSIVLPIFWRFLRDYQKDRIVSFLNPTTDPQGISYNLIQSVITAGSGGFLGRGLGLATQSRFMFLPASTTDFAYAALVEQFGFVGGVVVMILYVVIMYRIMRKAFYQPKYSYSFLFLIAVTLFFATHVFINIGMNLGLFPVTGIPLPIISYGGSSIVVSMMLLGLSMSL
ncbi:MAG TPA: FtsW/RodA/SpoVE family cell cycle protein [Patescibacteria group bacterium]|nr:FtsW/RodA/SpoVE family cell cycle protein [Patescibacteria group bacterium]